MAAVQSIVIDSGSDVGMGATLPEVEHIHVELLFRGFALHIRSRINTTMAKIHIEEASS